MYIICEKTYIERLGEKHDDETNLYDSDDVKSLLIFLKKQNVDITKRALYYAIKNKTLINNKYTIYKLKVK